MECDFYNSIKKMHFFGVKLALDSHIKVILMQMATWQAYPNIEDVYFTTHAYLGADNSNPRLMAI